MATRRGAKPSEPLEKASTGGLFRELGSTGLERFGGVIDEEKLPQLRGERAFKTFREMAEGDPVVGAVLFAVEMLLRQVSWRVEAGGRTPADAEARDLVETALDDMDSPWSDTLAEILTFLVFGFSLHELVYKRREGASRDPIRRSRYTDGRIGWRRWAPRAQETLTEWRFAEDSGDLEAFVQSAAPDFLERVIPIEKALLFRTTSRKASPQGRSILRSAFSSWYYKRKIQEIEAIGIERGLAGLPVAWVPAKILSDQATAAEKSLRDQIDKMLRNIRRDQQEGVIFPLEYYAETPNKVYDLTLLTTGNRAHYDTDHIIQRYDTRIAGTVLADFVLLGHERVGSFALASSKTSVFATALDAWLDSIRDVINRHAVPKLMDLNAMAVDAPPHLEHGDVESVDLTELGAYITALAGAGAPLFPDDTLEAHLREVAGLPERLDADADEPELRSRGNGLDPDAEAEAAAGVQ